MRREAADVGSGGELLLRLIRRYRPDLQAKRHEIGGDKSRREVHGLSLQPQLENQPQAGPRRHGTVTRFGSPVQRKENGGP